MQNGGKISPAVGSLWGCRIGKPKSLRCPFRSSGMFFITCVTDKPSGSALETIASTMSGARLFKPSSLVIYGGFQPVFSAMSVMSFGSFLTDCVWKNPAINVRVESSNPPAGMRFTRTGGRGGVSFPTDAATIFFAVDNLP